MRAACCLDLCMTIFADAAKIKWSAWPKWAVFRYLLLVHACNRAIDQNHTDNGLMRTYLC